VKLASLRGMSSISATSVLEVFFLASGAGAGSGSLEKLSLFGISGAVLSFS